MNNIMIVGNVASVKKNDVSADRVAYNFTVAVDEGYGDNKKTTFFNCAAFAKKGAQEKYFDDMIVKGARLPVAGAMGTGKPYTDKNGSTITPWILRVKELGTGINESEIVGRLTEDAQVTESGDKVIVKYTVAVNRKGKDAPADFIRCTQFGSIDGGLAKYASENLLKGSSIVVSGRQQTGSYTDKDGTKRKSQELIVKDSVLFGKKKETTTPTENNTARAAYTPPVDDSANDDDGFAELSEDLELPF